MIDLKNMQIELEKLTLSASEAKEISEQVADKSQISKETCWQHLLTEILIPKGKRHYSFPVHQYLYNVLYPNNHEIPAPIWFPNEAIKLQANISPWMQKKHFEYYNEFHHWSVMEYQNFWHDVITKFNIKFEKKYSAVVDLRKGKQSPEWLPNSQFNIINSCFNASPDSIAIIAQKEEGSLTKMSYGELNKFSNRIANGLKKQFKENDAIAIIMPMTLEAVAIYLGIIKAGMVVVSIADSFSAEEIALRLKIAEAKGVFTQNYIIREGKEIPLYERISNIHGPINIVLTTNNKLTFGADNKTSTLRQEDVSWETFLDENEVFTPVLKSANSIINILFSSGTTGDPKAIPWTQTVPIKCASDAYFHHNIKPQDIFCWPTNLGWMMGPWLIFACFINQATIAIYEGSPNKKDFGQFIQDQHINILGVVPTIVKTWRNSQCMESFNWQDIKLFSSTGECSNIDDMHYLMWLANYKPIIEYCGGTEIGGGFITSTIIEPNAPAAFNCKALGIDFVILDETGNLSEKGEIALIPPSIGLSNTLLNKDHNLIYYQDMPSFQGQLLRRHGDEIERYHNGFFRLHGRVDDTMKLAGIKVSSAEIEQILNQNPLVYETAAIAIEPQSGGPSRLIIYVVLKEMEKMNLNYNEVKNNDIVIDEEIRVTENILKLQAELQTAIKKQLNPLFKIYEVIPIKSLPRTASNKIMRRLLRAQYFQ